MAIELYNHGDHMLLTFCSKCGTLRMCKEHSFPFSGWWLECFVCEQYSMFYALKTNLTMVVNKA